ncbi:hypothetical protein [Marinobacter salarius]|uniref:hypothetical protein n=1 Tax=Marinobacter salarius TaxID=1420917 RepID=UPI003BADB210
MKLHVVAGFVALLFLSGCSNPPADPEVENFLVNRHESTPLSEVSSIFGIKILNGIRKDEVTYTADVEYQLVADISYSDFERIHEQELERDSQGLSEHDKLRLRLDLFKERAGPLRKLGEVNPENSTITGFAKGDTKLFSEKVSFKYTEDGWTLVSPD